MKRIKSNDGFAHYFFVILVVVVALTASVFALVLKAHNQAAASHAVTPDSAAQGGLTTNAQTQAGTTAINVPAPTTSSSHTSTNSSSKSTSTTGSSSSSSQSTTPSHNTATQTPTSVLTTVVTNLEKGVSADVTASDVNVPAAVSGSVPARPLVFTVNGTTYYAFTRVNPPDFNTSVATTVDSMAIVVASGKPALTQAHLDKSGNLVDANFKLVGYTPYNN